MERPPFLAAVVAAAAAVIGAACSSVPVVTPSPTVDPATEAIRAARTAVTAPAEAVHGAALGLAMSVENLRAAPSADPAARTRLLRDFVATGFDDMDRALSLADELELPSTPAAVAEAADAFAAAVAAAREVATGARADLQDLLAYADADARLAEIVSGWDAPGSYSEQLRRFEQFADDAESLGETLSGEVEVASCLTGFERRAAAAANVAEASRELRGLVEQRRGEEFDARRRELGGDPYGNGGRTLVEGDADDLPCWRLQAPVVRASDRVVAQLGRVEDALNP